MKVVRNFQKMKDDGKIKQLPVLLNAMATEGPPRDFYVLGIIEDGGEHFLVIRDSLTEKNYIERIVAHAGQEQYSAPVLEYIEDDALWGALVNFATAEKMLPNDFENSKVIITHG